MIPPRVVLPATIPALALAVVAAWPARSEDEGVSRAGDGGAILHRRLPAAEGGDAAAPFIIYDKEQQGEIPREFQRDGQVLPAPPLDPGPRPGEAVYSEAGVLPADELVRAPSAPAPGVPGREIPGEPGGVDETFDPRGTVGDQARPDRDTRREGRLDYHAVFDPAIVPFKRNRALDTIGREYELSVERGPLTQLTPIGNRVTPGREAFWGSVLIEAVAGRAIPLPSVSPESAILSYEVSPEVPLRFFKDQADNYYVRASADGRVRLVFVMDAPTGYFGRALPADLRAKDVPPERRPHPPGRALEAGVRFASSLGITDRTPYDRALSDLVGYFRAFEPGEPLERPGADIYLDLARGKRGICRHRVFAFVVTAQALGIPARYVFNEAHVFAEVWVPGKAAGWLRVDLGGGAEELVVHGGQDKLLHRPTTRDPFQRPESFAKAESEGRLAGAERVAGAPAPARPGAEPGPSTADAATRAAESLGQQVRPAHAVAGTIATRTELAFDGAEVFRGEGLAVRGQVSDPAGAGPHEGHVQILLVSAGKPPVLLGTARLDGGGRFASVLRVPQELLPGGYELIAEYLGDGVHQGSKSP